MHITQQIHEALHRKRRQLLARHVSLLAEVVSDGQRRRYVDGEVRECLPLPNPRAPEELLVAVRRELVELGGGQPQQAASRACAGSPGAEVSSTMSTVRGDHQLFDS